MDFNFSLILLVAVAVTGGVWLLDLVWLKKLRAQDAEQPIVVEYSISFFPVLLLVFVIRSFLFEPFQIPSESMVPTLEVGDFILVNKFAYGVRLPVIGTKVIPVADPEPGDVMVFIPPHTSRYYIKRVIGLPGDYIRIENNQVWVNNVAYTQERLEKLNDQMLSSDYLSNESIGERVHGIHTRVPSGRYGRNQEYVVPDGHYFMMGDNRDNSLDSRSWGAVPEANIVGKAVAIWMHWKNWDWPTFSRAGAIQ